MSSPTLVFAAGSGRFEQMSLYLARSIDLQTSHDFVVWIPEKEKSAITDEVLNELSRRSASVATGTTTLPEYGQSAKLDALVATAERCDPPYVLLDTDTIVCESLDGILGESNLAAKPVDIGRQYWGSSESIKEWKDLYSENGFEFPEYQTISSVDRVETVPYYNAGVVGVACEEFPQRWLDLTRSVYDQLSEQYFADQVSLAMLMTELNSQEFSEMFNYPCPLRIHFPKNIKVLHYHSNYSLTRLWYSEYRGLLNKIGFGSHMDGLSRLSILSHFLHSLDSLLRTRYVKGA